MKTGLAVENHTQMLQLGEIVKDLSPVMRPRRDTLEGRVVLVQPLDPLVHGDALYQGTHSDHSEELWRYLPEGPFPDRPTFDVYLKHASVSADPLFFAIVDKPSGLAAGMAAYLRIDPIHKVIEVGHILFTPKLQRTVAATEAMFLMAKHVFDLGYRRYEWKCNSLNAPSLSAARRLGFTFEGVFRQHMIVKGRNRDTAWFSMLDSEWPARKASFEQWLDAKNFDENGVQKSSLSAGNRAVLNPGL